MKSVIKEKVEKRVERPYPKLMEGTGGLVVLMMDYETGIVLRGNEYNDMGYLCHDWNITIFKEFEGVLELSND